MKGFCILLLLLAYVVTYAASRELSLPISVTQPKKNSRKHYRNALLPPQDAENQLENVVSQASISSSNIYGPLCIFGGTLVHSTLGTKYCWGNFLSYAPQFLKFYDGLEHKGAQPDALIVLPLTILSMCVSMPLGPIIVKAIGASKTMLLGGWIMSSGVFLASYAKSLSTFLAFYAIMFGTGTGLAYTAPMVAGWKWMPNQKGLVSGIILTGFGAGGFFFNLIGTHLVNPKSLDVVNGKFPDEVYNSFPSMLRKLAVIYAGLQFVGALLVSEPKAQPKPAEQSVAGSTSPEATVAAPPGVSIVDALKTPQFWVISKNVTFTLFICSVDLFRFLCYLHHSKRSS
jgi:MFS family permease